MTGPTIHDDTSDDHVRFEAERVAQDRDRSQTETADIDDRTVRQIVEDLVETGTIRPIPDEQVLVHEPSGEVFDSSLQVVVFHCGWSAACDAGDQE
jgi:hypothetical protein